MREIVGALVVVAAMTTASTVAHAHDRSGIVVGRAGPGAIEQDDPGVLERTLEDRIGAHLRSRGIGPRRTPADPVLTVQIREDVTGEPSFVIDARVGPRILEDAHAEGQCFECDAPALAEAVLRALGPAIAAIHALELVPRPTPSPSAPKPDPARRGAPVTAHVPVQPPTLDPRRVAGWASLATGLAAVASGAVFLGTDEVRISAPGHIRHDVQDFRLAGIVTTSIGAAAVLAGVILLPLQGRKNRNVRKDRMTLHLGMGFAGVRFR